MTTEQDIERRWQELVTRLEANPRTSGDLTALTRALNDQPTLDISHTECVTLLPDFVIDEIQGVNVIEKYPLLYQHLATCESCEKEYADLLTEAVSTDTALPKVPFTLPAIRLDFLPPLSLPDYIRYVAFRISREQFAGFIGNFDSIASDFFRMIEERGDFALFHSRPVFMGQSPDTLVLLSATYTTTVSLVQTLKPEWLNTPDTLRSEVEGIARVEAQRQGLSPQDAKQFADSFMHIVDETPATLYHLSKG